MSLKAINCVLFFEIPNENHGPNVIKYRKLDGFSKQNDLHPNVINANIFGPNVITYTEFQTVFASENSFPVQMSPKHY